MSECGENREHANSLASLHEFAGADNESELRVLDQQHSTIAEKLEGFSYAISDLYKHNIKSF